MIPTPILSEESFKHEILDLLTFSPEDGRIWMDDKRMLLLDAETFGSMRAEIVHLAGTDSARRLLTRIGYQSGVTDAQVVARRWPADSKGSAPLGPHIHALQGHIRVQEVSVRRDPDTAKFLEGEWLWLHGVEDDVHIDHFGVGTEAACWLEVGYATGFVSTLTGEMTVFREVSCRSSGSNVCRVIGKSIGLWDDISEDLHYLGIDNEHDDDRTPSSYIVPGDVRSEAAPPDDAERSIVGTSPSIKSALHQLRAVAPTRATVLLTGESGVGKELFARELHNSSKRSSSPFIAINCAAIPDTLIESELFGAEKGAFTGAAQTRIGRFERACGGTLFLDEISTLTLVAQAKLLRVLQEGELERIGGTKTIKVDVRIIAATNDSLVNAVKTGDFREDLFYRLNVFPINLPPLRERRDDIPMLLDHFLRHFSEIYDKPIPGFTNRAYRALLNYRFPGNIRELKNLIERAVILSDGDPIELSHVFSEIGDGHVQIFFLGEEGKLNGNAAQKPIVENHENIDVDLLADRFFDDKTTRSDMTIASFEDDLFRSIASKALRRSDGNLSAAARMIGMKRHQFEYRSRALGVAVDKL
ncbi:MAG TPA: sigma-54-dependent Fis family transcriptional regulator [Sphingobium sp.]|nr:sigma-54-dependent Fis family transcriptional regulator [Sphingobium sp.]